MKIDYSKYNIKKISYKNKEYEVSLIYYDDNGIRLAFEEKRFLDEFEFDFQKQYYLDKIQCIGSNDEKMTLFEARFTIKIRDDGSYLAHIIFNRVIYEFVNSYELKCNKLKVVLDNTKYNINDIFKFNKVNLSDNITLILGSNCFCFESSSVISSNYLYSIFISFYEYFNLLIGFFPPIENIIYYLDDKEFKYEFNIVEKYITKKDYIKNDSFFATILNEKNFLMSFNEFQILRKKISLPFDVYYFSMMERSAYIEDSVVHILQSFDGLFDKMKMFDEKKYLFDDKIKENIIKRYNEIDLSDICDSDTFDVNRIKGLLGYINRPSNSLKIGYILNVYEKIFENEKKKQIDEEKTYYDELIKKMVNTRNKFSHATIENKKSLNGKECALYIIKLFLAFRLCIMKEIEIEYNAKMLDSYISNIDKWINDESEKDKA